MKSIASLKVGSMPGFMQRTYGRVANTRIGGVLTKERSLMSSGSKRAPHVRRIDCVGACFVAGTQVLTDQGLKNIEDIKVGDFVLAKDELTKKSDYKPVVNLLTTHPYVLFTITYKDIAGEAYEIKVSGEHPFWVADKGWVSARQLAIDDKLIVSDENIVVISSITSEKAAEGKTFTTYNFEVADYHTYFVLQEGKKDGIFAVWVHNVGDDACQIVFNIDLTDFRKTHILNRHRFGSNMLGKSEFPNSWSDEKILHYISDIATDPKSEFGIDIIGKSKWEQPFAKGVREGVEIRVDFYPKNSNHANKISTGYPSNISRNTK